MELCCVGTNFNAKRWLATQYIKNIWRQCCGQQWCIVGNLTVKATDWMVQWLITFSFPNMNDGIGYWTPSCSSSVVLYWMIHYYLCDFKSSKKEGPQLVSDWLSQFSLTYVQTSVLFYPVQENHPGITINVEEIYEFRERSKTTKACKINQPIEPHCCVCVCVCVCGCVCVCVYR